MVTHHGQTVVESRTCLLPMIRPEIRALLQFYPWYKSGTLPYAGGLLDQPAVYLEAMRLIESSLAERRNG